LGKTRIAATTVRSYLAVVIGYPFYPVALYQSFINLFATGLFV
jgi:hypothetical protein